MNRVDGEAPVLCFGAETRRLLEASVRPIQEAAMTEIDKKSAIAILNRIMEAELSGIVRYTQ